MGKILLGSDLDDHLLDYEHGDVELLRQLRSAARLSVIISSGVIGKCGDIDGVCIAPVTAQEMITFLSFVLSLVIFDFPLVSLVFQFFQRQEFVRQI